MVHPDLETAAIKTAANLLNKRSTFRKAWTDVFSAIVSDTGQRRVFSEQLKVEEIEDSEDLEGPFKRVKVVTKARTLTGYKPCAEVWVTVRELITDADRGQLASGKAKNPGPGFVGYTGVKVGKPRVIINGYPHAYKGPF